MAYCVNCGKQNLETAKFCTSCGNKINLLEPKNSPSIPASVADTLPGKKSNSPNTGKIIIFAALAIVLLGLGVWYFTYYQPKQKAIEITTMDSVKMAQNVEPDNSNIKVDEEKRRVVEDYFTAANERDFDRISNFYAPVIRRNWDVYNPTLSQIEVLTRHLWEVTSSSIQSIKQLRMENTYTVIADVSNVYVTRKKGIMKEKNYYIYFVFDQSNKIVETYGYEKN